MKSLLLSKYNLILFLLIIFFISSCEKTPEKNNTPTLIEKGKGVFITNEGNYQWGNATISYYRSDSKTIADDVFNSINARPLGDVCQSMTISGDVGYIVVNNSGKVEIVNMKDFKSIATISGFSSPRYLLVLNPGKAYISDLYSNTIQVADLHTNTITKSIPCKGSTEEMCLYGNKVFVTNTRSEYLYVVDTLSETVIDSIKLSYASNSICKDKYNKLWVLCCGKDAQKAEVYCVNPDNLLVEKSIPLNVVLNIWNRIALNPEKDVLYLMNNGVFKMNVSASAFESTALINSNGKNLYSFGVNANDGDIYVSDAMDFIQKGWVFRYNNIGLPLDTFKTGIIPSGFWFY